MANLSEYFLTPALEWSEVIRVQVLNKVELQI